MQKKVTRINAVVRPDRVTDCTAALRKAGVQHFELEAGRAPVLEERRGISALFSASGNRLLNDPVEIINFMVDPERENDMLGLIAEQARLHIPGMGSVYSEDLELVQSTEAIGPNQVERWRGGRPENTFSEVVGLACIVVRGEGDRIARAVLESGACVPIITFGIGTGVRDKLGLLRITLPAEKEVVTCFLSSYDAESVIELMIEAGNLDQIGRGILYVFSVKQGIINTRITQGASGHAASMEQIISALDGLKGGMEWRRRGTETRTQERGFLTGNVGLSIHCKEGRGFDLVQAAMGAGAAGATVSKSKFVSTLGDGTGPKVSPAREVCNMIVGKDAVGTIVDAIGKEGAFEEHTHGMVVTHAVPRAFVGMR